MFLDITHFVAYNIFSMVSFYSYTVVLWLKLESSSLTSDKMPLFCTRSSTICLWISNGIVYGQYGNNTVNSTSPINSEVWTSLVFIYDESGEYTFPVHIDVIYSLPHSGLLSITTKERKVWRYQREVIRIRISKKDRQHNGEKKKIYKRTNNDLQNTTHKSKDRATRTQLKTSLI